MTLIYIITNHHLPCSLIIYKLWNLMAGLHQLPPHSFDTSFLHLLSALSMYCHYSKGKQKASPPASRSFDEGDPQDVLEEHYPTKKCRVSSPAHVKQAALARVASTSMSGSSSKKGLADFAALINGTSLAAACKETN